MSDVAAGKAPRVNPRLAWTVLTEAPLQGMALAREAGLILAWDDADQLYLLDAQGERRSMSRAPDRILAGTISDSGTLIALLGKGPRLWLLSADLEPISDRPAPSDPSALAVDPHGRYVAVGSKLDFTQFFTRHGKQAGRFETKQPLAHLCFVPGQEFLLATAAYGAVLGIELEPGGAGRKLRAEVVWQQALMSNVGRLATTGDGGMVLVSCFAHGVQRYDLRGHNEGSYHLGGTASQAVPDFLGRSIAVATTEGDLAVLNSSGNVRWKTTLPRAVNALEIDALGRYLVYGLPTGEVTRLDLEAATGRTVAASTTPIVQTASAHRSGPVRTPAWSVPVAQSDEQAETAVLAVLDDPVRVAFLTGKNRLQVFTDQGQHLGQGPELAGVGRVLRTAPGWIAAATDRQIALFDARRTTMHHVDLSLVELTHLVARPDTYGLAIVQERDRIGRASPAGRWIWKRELRTAIEDLAVGPGGATAITTEDGQLLIFDAAGEPVGRFSANQAEALCMVEAPTGSAQEVTWITLARRFQTLLGHDLRGRVVWETPVPWEGWQLHRVGDLVVATSADGHALAYDANGQLRSQSRDADPQGVYCPGPDGETWVIVRQGVHLICSDLPGRVVWRAVANGPFGPIAAGLTGAAVLIGRAITWFPFASTH